MSKAPLVSVRDRLLVAARACFLAQDYHAVTTRRIAELAGANVSMIRYYFGNKGGLYEEMIRSTLEPLLDALDHPFVPTEAGIADYLKLYYRTMLEIPEFPGLILKIVALREAPGRRFVQQLLERGRAGGRRQVEKATVSSAGTIDADVVRLSFVSMAITPILLKDLFEEQNEKPFDAVFLEALAALNGRMLARALAGENSN